jgi:hypothetical protein
VDRFPCPYLHAEVELTDERRQHILASHPEFGSDVMDKIRLALVDPDEVRTDPRFPATHLISRWFDDLLTGKILVVAVVTDEPDSTQSGLVRHWIVTAYPTRRVTQGIVEWTRH